MHAALLDFLRDLAAHNERPWFQANRERYERDVREPMFRFMADLESRLHRISRHLVVDPRPVGGSMMRIHRDTRFSKDKSPYKLNVGLHFGLSAPDRDIHTPGYYLHLQPGQCFAGGGMWHPDPASLGRIRDAIVEDPKGWQTVRKTGMALSGDALKRAPAGCDPAHPWIDDLKRKDFIGVTNFTDSQVCNSHFLDDFVGACREMAPLLRFLARAQGLSW